MPTENGVEHLMELWQFVNHYFSYNYPYSIKKIFRINTKQLEELGFTQEAVLTETEKGTYILINMDRFTTENPNYKAFIDKGYSENDYFDSLLIHEFIHKLEDLTHRKLMTTQHTYEKIFIDYLQSR